MTDPEIREKSPLEQLLILVEARAKNGEQVVAFPGYWSADLRAKDEEGKDVYMIVDWYDHSLPLPTYITSEGKICDVVVNSDYTTDEASEFMSTVYSVYKDEPEPIIRKKIELTRMEEVHEAIEEQLQALSDESAALKLFMQMEAKREEDAELGDLTAQTGTNLVEDEEVLDIVGLLTRAAEVPKGRSLKIDFEGALNDLAAGIPRSVIASWYGASYETKGEDEPIK